MKKDRQSRPDVIRTNDFDCAWVHIQGLSVVRGCAEILNDVNLSIAEGETVAIMGPNGAGKSTLLKCVAGAMQPTAGWVSCVGLAARSSTPARRRIGFMGHETGLYPELTAFENLLFAARMYGLEQPGQRARAQIEETGLKAMTNRAVGELSHGVRQRLAIARATIHEPSLIVLDEPFSNLDVGGRRWLERRFGEWRAANRTVCFASHDVEQSNRLADRVVWLESGQAREFLVEHKPGCERRSA
jgi:heme exporter protein A